MSGNIIKDVRMYIDEAGRGPLAGPVFVGIILPLHKIDTSSFFDSKQLTRFEREKCYKNILALEENGACVFASGRAENNEIDAFGIIIALRIATLRSMKNLLRKLFEKHWKQQLQSSVYGEDIIAIKKIEQFLNTDENIENVSEILSLQQNIYKFKGLLIDGNHSFGLEKFLTMDITTIIKGDQKNSYISMASIVAKVERDHRMESIAPYFSQYDFLNNKGYGTKKHRESIKSFGITSLHRKTFLRTIMLERLGTDCLLDSGDNQEGSLGYDNQKLPQTTLLPGNINTSEKPSLLLHICCAPDLTRPLHWLKDHFKLYLFRYNPNIHPRKEHEQRYAQFLKLIGLEPGDYEIVEDRYDPKEFFDAMYEKKELIHQDLIHADYKTVQQKSGSMEEWSDRCNPCYLMRLEQAAKQAQLLQIPYFSSTLLISPKKKMEKLFFWGLEAEKKYQGTKFLRFDFIKNNGYNKASALTKQHGLWRQNYCGCGRTIPKPGERLSIKNHG